MMTITLPRLIFLLIVGLWLPIGVACRPQPQEQPPHEAQVDRGASAYARACTECHDPGRIGPVIRGPDLLKYGTAVGLYDYNRRTMPIQNPGSLSDQEYWDMTAFMLNRERFLPAGTVLGPENGEEITITR